MTPTRELAVQVAKQLEIYSKNHKLKVAVIYGGQNIQKEIVTFKQ
jgi:superfamily II DNA/RNA helicase